MRIVVNDIAASGGGAMSVLRDFYSFVCKYDHENEWFFLLGDDYFEETENVKILKLPEIKNSRIKKLFFDLLTGKNYIKQLKPDIVFSLQNIITFGLNIPQIVYVHQAIPFQKSKRFSFFKRSERSLAVYQYLIGFLIKQSIKKSDKVIVQTEWMKKAVCEQCNVSADKVVRVSPNVSVWLGDKDDISFDQRSFFYPTADAIYKNNECIFTACECLNADGIEHEVVLTLPKDKECQSVSCVGRISQEEVYRNYCKSTLIFPSYIESFGYPLVEAKNVGTIVLASDCPFSREILCSYENAYFFDPFKPEELKKLMLAVIHGEIQKKSTKKVDSSEDISCWEAVIKYIWGAARH